MKHRTLRSVLFSPDGSAREWLFLPRDAAWDLDSLAVIAEMNEVPPEQEDNEDAGYPEFIRAARLMAALPVSMVQGIVFNARAQKPNLSETELLEAFLYYYDNDAYATIA